MNSFSGTSNRRLATCHPDLQLIFNEVIRWQDCSIFCGHRNEEDQNYAYVMKRSQVRWPDSKHNTSPSMAVDAGPYFSELRNTDWEDIAAFAMFAGRVLQVADQLLKDGDITHKLVWGGDWDGDGRTADHKFIDAPHFQLVTV